LLIKADGEVHLPTRIETAMVITRQKREFIIAWRNRDGGVGSAKAWELGVLVAVAFAITPALQGHPGLRAGIPVATQLLAELAPMPDNR